MIFGQHLGIRYLYQIWLYKKFVTFFSFVIFLDDRGKNIAIFQKKSPQLGQTPQLFKNTFILIILVRKGLQGWNLHQSCKVSISKKSLREFFSFSFFFASLTQILGKNCQILHKIGDSEAKRQNIKNSCHFF